MRGIQEGYGLVSSTLIAMAEAILARDSSDSNDESFIVKESCGFVSSAKERQVFVIESEKSSDGDGVRDVYVLCSMLASE